VDVVESKQTGGASSQEIQVRSQERIYDLHHGRLSRTGRGFPKFLLYFVTPSN
jgi:hypothetical protein